MNERIDAHLPLTHVVYHVLLALAGGAMHGYGILKDVSERTSGRVELEAGTLYAAIKRLRDEGLLDEASPPAASGDARRRYYRLTELGRAVLRAESERLAELVALAREKRVIPGPAEA